MNSRETPTIFAGVDGQAPSALPAWYRGKTSLRDLVSFAEAIRSVPRAVETTVAYNNPYSGDWVETERVNALVDPGERLRRQECARSAGRTLRDRRL